MLEDRTTTALRLYSEAKLAVDVNQMGHIYKKGTIGQIVEVHAGGAAYELELTNPYTVVTVKRDALLPL